MSPLLMVAVRKVYADHLKDVPVAGLPATAKHRVYTEIGGKTQELILASFASYIWEGECEPAVESPTRTLSRYGIGLCRRSSHGACTTVSG